MLGPIIVYWVELALILVGWIFSGFKDTLRVLLLFIELFVIYIFASIWQWRWIDGVREIYNGDQNTVENTVDNLAQYDPESESQGD